MLKSANTFIRKSKIDVRVRLVGEGGGGVVVLSSIITPISKLPIVLCMLISSVFMLFLWIQKDSGLFGALLVVCCWFC
ncbi:hypothetical protein D3C76_1297950 [compost metagenome]